MSEYSVERRKALIEQMRSQEGGKSSSLSVPERYRDSDRPDSSGEEFGSFRLWKVKFFIALFLFAGFLFLDVTGTKLYKVSGKAVETAITDTVNTKQVSNFVQNKISGILDF